MNIFSINDNLFKRSSPAKMSKRFVSCVINMIFTMLATSLVFSAIFKIVENTNEYKKEKDIVTYEVNYYKDLICSTHLVEYNEDSQLSAEVLAYKNINKAIYLSYHTYSSNPIDGYFIDSNHEITLYGMSSLENDNLAYFYTQYLPNNDLDGKIVNFYGENPISYLYNLYLNAYGEYASLMFSFDENISKIPVLNQHISYYIYHYLYVDDNDAIGQNGAKYYEIFSGGYITLIKESIQKVIVSEPYFSEHYLVYEEARVKQARYTNITLVVSVFISYLLIVLLPKYLLKYERSIGYFLLGLGVLNIKSDDNNKWYIILIKSLIESFGYLFIILILYLFPPFNGDFKAISYPFIEDTKISLIIIILILTLIGSIINIIGLFTNNNQNGIDLLFNDKVVDIRYLDEKNNE